jgi:hypothetical protein
LRREGTEIGSMPRVAPPGSQFLGSEQPRNFDSTDISWALCNAALVDTDVERLLLLRKESLLDL